jgi:hypothetical protein
MLRWARINESDAQNQEKTDARTESADHDGAR